MYLIDCPYNLGLCDVLLWLDWGNEEIRYSSFSAPQAQLGSDNKGMWIQLNSEVLLSSAARAPGD